MFRDKFNYDKLHIKICEREYSLIPIENLVLKIWFRPL